MHFPCSALPKRPRIYLGLLPFLAVALVSCANLRSTPMGDAYNTRPGGKTNHSSTNSHHGFGENPMVRYYLPIPYIQIYAHEVRIMGRDTLRIGARAVAVPDVSHPLLLDNNYSALVKHDLRVSLSPEGFLDRITYNREPQVAQAVGKVAQAVMSAMSPVPLPFKGDGDFPEFTRLVFLTNCPVTTLLGCTNSVTIGIGSRKFTISAIMISQDPQDADARKKLNYGPSPKSCAPLAQIKGIYHRPLVPIQLTITQQYPTNGGYEIPVQIVGGINNFLKFQDPKTAQNVSNALQTATNSTTSLQFSLKAPDESKRPIAELPAGITEPSRPATAEVVHDNELKLRIPFSGTNVLRIPETPLVQENILYVPDPAQVDAFYFRTPFFAKQSADLFFSGGTLSEIRAGDDGELMGLVDSLLGAPGAVTATVSGIFTVHVHHHSDAKSTDGGKGTGRGQGEQLKD